MNKEIKNKLIQGGKMKNNRNVLIILFAIIGLIMISVGISQIIKLNSYSKTTGKFSHSDIIKGEDSEADTYIWYYEYNVDNNTYIAKTNTKHTRQSSSNKDITIYYDSTNPEKNVTSNNHTRYYLIIIGLVFTSILLFYSKKIELEESEESRARNDAKKMGWFLLLFTGSIFFITLDSYDFSFSAIISTMLTPVLILIVFIICGVKILINAYDPKHIFKYEYENGTKIVTDKNYSENNLANDELNSEVVQNKVNTIKGII